MDEQIVGPLGLVVLCPGTDPIVDIVAVHGLGANPSWAWVRKVKMNDTGEEKTVKWLEQEDMLRKEIPNARIMTFNYESKWHANAPKQRRALCAEQLLAALHDQRKAAGIEHRPLIFIGHSFGGIVIEQALVTANTHDNYRHLAIATTGIIFLGTPHRGTAATKWVEELEKKAQTMPNTMLAYYFCDDKDEKRNTATAILRGLILQLLRHHHDLFQHLEDFDWRSDLLTNFEALWNGFVRILRDPRAGEIVILIDALDECERSSRRELLSGLAEISLLNETSGKFKFLITCRPIDDIRHSLLDIGECLRIDTGKVNADLSKFIKAKMGDLARKHDYSKNLRDYVENRLRLRAGGTFLWVSLVLSDLERTSKHRVRAKLRDLPSGLDAIYCRILQQIEQKEDAKFILQCVIAARRPLTTDELAVAYVLELGDCEVNTVPPREVLEEANAVFRDCGPILYLDDQNNTVNLVHQSAKDYLVDTSLCVNAGLSQYQVVPDKANLLMFRVCWKYLAKDDFERGDVIMRDDFYKWMRKTYSFLQYAADEWESHAMAAARELVSEVEWMNHNAAQAPILRDALLRAGSRQGHGLLVQQLILAGADVNVKSKLDCTALCMAASLGHVEVLAQLLQAGADVNATSTTESRDTALQYAKKYGLTHVVKYGLTHMANLLQQVDRHRGADISTALHVAAKHGHAEVVDRLLRAGADVNTSGKWGGMDATPLDVAELYDREEVVRKLRQAGGKCLVDEMIIGRRRQVRDG
ncbi:hypothetical protein F4802DRAFT_597245 [Xylaria palmicola]|nr:hypothetical protein F4802DRAFT_597245 [Xylaria palmicola]